MGHRIRSGEPARGRRGFTLIEILIVITIVSILVTMAIPIYQKAIVGAKESVLRNNLFTMRMMIDEYSYDKQKAPQTLQDLVSEGYMRDVPIDPMTGSNQSWRTEMEPSGNAVDQSSPGIWEVKSGSDKTARDGTKYSDW